MPEVTEEQIDLLADQGVSRGAQFTRMVLQALTAEGGQEHPLETFSSLYAGAYLLRVSGQRAGMSSEIRRVMAAIERKIDARRN